MAEHLDSLTLLFNFAYSIALPCIDWLEMDLQRKVNEETGLLWAEDDHQNSDSEGSSNYTFAPTNPAITTW